MTMQGPGWPSAPTGAFLIWSIEHDAWWRPGRAGYTRNLAEAGVYTKAQADAILARANYPPGTFHECAIPEACLRLTTWSVPAVDDR